jgi:hypothetical protein
LPWPARSSSVGLLLGACPVRRACSQSLYLFRCDGDTSYVSTLHSHSALVRGIWAGIVACLPAPARPALTFGTYGFGSSLAFIVHQAAPSTMEVDGSSSSSDDDEAATAASTTAPDPAASQRRSSRSRSKTRSIYDDAALLSANRGSAHKESASASKGMRQQQQQQPRGRSRGRAGESSTTITTKGAGSSPKKPRRGPSPRSGGSRSSRYAHVNLLEREKRRTSVQAIPVVFSSSFHGSRVPLQPKPQQQQGGVRRRQLGRGRRRRRRRGKAARPFAPSELLGPGRRQVRFRKVPSSEFGRCRHGMV